MRATLLVLHRHERYEGEFLPEILTVVDEVTQDENPEWWPAEVKRIQEQFDDSTVSAWAEITIEIETRSMLDALYPPTASIPVSIISAPSDETGPS